MKTHHWKESITEKLHFMSIQQPMNTRQMNITKFQQNETSDRYSASAHNFHRQVSFFCPAPRAKSVELVGDFNDWQPMPMNHAVDGWWTAQVELCHGHHHYQFLVDGQPMLDPHATGTVCNERDERVSLIAVS